MATTEERERIAREMHDSLAQVLGYVNTKAQAAQELIEQGRGDRAAEQISQLAAAARDAYVDVREGILGLRASTEPVRPFLEALGAYLDRWQDQSGISVDYNVPPLDRLPITSFAELQLLRIVQEALTNVRKHARATRVIVRLAGSETAVTIEITDNGLGFDPQAPGQLEFPRFGLATMRERAEAVGGRLHLTTAPGAGTTLTVTLPHERHASRKEDQRAGAYR
jgi:signal transduction histidine kinase